MREPESQTIELDWSEVDATPIQYANELLLQQFRGEIILNLGLMSPPSRPTETSVITVKVLARVGINAGRFVEFARAMQRVAARLEEMGLADTTETEEEDEPNDP